MKRILLAVAFLAFSSTLAADDWPQWRGPERNGISKESGLLAKWPKDGPKLAWQVKDFGTGYSSVAVVKGRVYTQTTKGNEEFVVALDEKSGKEIWSTAIGKVGKNQMPPYPGTRATPTVDGKHLYCLASDGELNCVDTDGKVVWHKNLAKDFAGKVGSWAYTESVLVDGDVLVCTPGGEKATLAALKKENGETVWEAKVPGGDIADYASIMISEGGGRKQYVQYMRKSVVGVDAKTGKFLWKHSRTQDAGASILTPIVQGNKVFVAGSRTGGATLELKAEGDGIAATELFFEKTVAPSIGGAVLLDGHLYGSSGVNLICADFTTGKVKWTDRSVGPASVCVADGKLYARGYDSGDIALIDPNPEAYKELSRFKQPERSKAKGWPHPVVANGRLYIRDWETLLCFEVK